MLQVSVSGLVVLLGVWQCSEASVVPIKTCTFSHAMREAYLTNRLYCAINFRVNIPYHNAEHERIDFVRRGVPVNTECVFECYNQTLTEFTPILCDANGQWSKADAQITTEFLRCVRAVNGMANVATIQLPFPPEIMITPKDPGAEGPVHDVPPPPPLASTTPPPTPTTEGTEAGTSDPLDDTSYPTTSVPEEPEETTTKKPKSAVVDLGYLASNRHFQLVFPREAVDFAAGWEGCVGGGLGRLNTEIVYNSFRKEVMRQWRTILDVLKASTCTNKRARRVWLGGRVNEMATRWRWVTSSNPSDPGVPMEDTWSDVAEKIRRTHGGETAVGIDLSATMMIYNRKETFTNCILLCETHHHTPPVLN